MESQPETRTARQAAAPWLNGCSPFDWAKIVPRVVFLDQVAVEEGLEDWPAPVWILAKAVAVESFANLLVGERVAGTAAEQL
jgi:hypothetical protein